MISEQVAGAQKQMKQLEEMFSSSGLTAEKISTKAHAIIRKIGEIRLSMSRAGGAVDSDVATKLALLETHAQLYIDHADAYVVTHQDLANKLKQMRRFIEEFQSQVSQSSTQAMLDQHYQIFKDHADHFLSSCAPVDIRSSQQAFTVLSMFRGPRQNIEQEIEKAKKQYESKKVKLSQMRAIPSTDADLEIVSINQEITAVIGKYHQKSASEVQTLYDLDSLRIRWSHNLQNSPASVARNAQNCFDRLKGIIQDIESKLTNSYRSQFQTIRDGQCSIGEQIKLLYDIHTDLLSNLSNELLPESTKARISSLAKEIMQYCISQARNEISQCKEISLSTSEKVKKERELLESLKIWTPSVEFPGLMSLQEETEELLQAHSFVLEKQQYKDKVLAALSRFEKRHNEAHTFQEKQKILKVVGAFCDKALGKLDELGFSSKAKMVLMQQQQTTLLRMYENTVKQLRKDCFQAPDLKASQQMQAKLKAFSDEMNERLDGFIDRDEDVQNLRGKLQQLISYEDCQVSFLNQRSSDPNVLLKNDCYRVTHQVEDLLEIYGQTRDVTALEKASYIKRRFEEYAGRFGSVEVSPLQQETREAIRSTILEIDRKLKLLGSPSSVALPLDSVEFTSGFSLTESPKVLKSWQEYVDRGNRLLENAERSFRAATSREEKVQVREALKHAYDYDYDIKFPKDVPESDLGAYQECMHAIKRRYDDFCVQTAQELFQVPPPSQIDLSHILSPLVPLAPKKRVRADYGSLRNVIDSRRFSLASFEQKRKMWPQIKTQLSTIPFFKNDQNLQVMLQHSSEDDAMDGVAHYLLALHYQNLQNYFGCNFLSIPGHRSWGNLAQDYEGATLNPELLTEMPSGRSKNASLQLQQIQATEKVEGIVKIRGDGNCYYRSIMYGYLKEVMQLSDLERKRTLDKLYATMSSIYPQLPTSEQGSYLQFMSFLKEAANNREIAQSFDEYLLLENSPIDRGMIMGYRYALADWIRTKGEFYIVPSTAERGTPTVLGDSLAVYAQYTVGLEPTSKYSSTERYLREVVQCWGRDAEGPVVDLSVGAFVLNCKITTSVLDVNHESFMNPLIVGDPDAPISVKTLLRPGHYEILYGSWNRARDHVG